jgi:hypothetical protein
MGEQEIDRKDVIERRAFRPRSTATVWQLRAASALSAEQIWGWSSAHFKSNISDHHTEH